MNAGAAEATVVAVAGNDDGAIEAPSSLVTSP
jgi:hypothetical protein